ncbi:MAG: hypothetical protein EZS28_014669 [Streblomastix strix]|uniref:Uncharacterized protein n=1 Tax=Streblomastix strix TaxID=222440 RepID=A0A5J4W480_9EUKA|nr:MAG: hypothetical protein EZS28_014669 [Streblomastix strix]
MNQAQALKNLMENGTSIEYFSNGYIMQVKDKIKVYEKGKKSARTLTQAQQTKLLLETRGGGQVKPKRTAKRYVESDFDDDEVEDYPTNIDNDDDCDDQVIVEQPRQTTSLLAHNREQTDGVGLRFAQTPKSTSKKIIKKPQINYTSTQRSLCEQQLRCRRVSRKCTDVVVKNGSTVVIKLLIVNFPSANFQVCSLTALLKQIAPRLLVFEVLIANGSVLFRAASTMLADSIFEREVVQNKMSKKGKKRLIPAYTQPVTWEEEMAIKDPMTVDGQEVNPSNVGRVPQMLKTKGIKLKKGMPTRQKQQIADQINAADPEISKHEALVGVLGLTNKTMNRRVYGPLFGEELKAEFFENSIMLNNEGKLITEKLDQPSMDLGRSSPGLSPEQINNEIMYSGSYKQKEKENQRIDDIYDIQTQQDLGQSSVLEDIQPTMPLMQEKLIEKQQQAIGKDLASQENLAQIYDVGALDWGRMPVNDQFNRQQFKTQKTGYQMNADGSISATIKKENTKISPGEKKPKSKKNYIPTSQLLQSAKKQSSFKKKKRIKK